MNKADLIDEVAATTGQTKVAVAATIQAVMETIIETVGADGSVTLSGFGTFESRQRARPYRSQSEDRVAVPIPPKRVPAFRPGNAFKDAVQD